MIVTTSEIINIREGRLKEQTKYCTKWATKVYQGKRCFKLSFKMNATNLLVYNYKVYTVMRFTVCNI